MSKQNGPRVRFEATCSGCVHESTEHYSVEDGNDIDSGCDVYCNHPEVIAASKVGSRGRIGDTTWATPNWCPLLVVAVENLIRERKAGVG